MPWRQSFPSASYSTSVLYPKHLFDFKQFLFQFLHCVIAGQGAAGIPRGVAAVVPDSQVPAEVAAVTIQAAGAL